MHGLPIAFLLLLKKQHSSTVNDVYSPETSSSKNLRLQNQKVLHHSLVHLANEGNEKVVVQQTLSAMDLRTQGVPINTFRLGTSLISLVLSKDMTKPLSSFRTNSNYFHADSKLDHVINTHMPEDSTNERTVFQTISDTSENEVKTQPSKSVPCLTVFSVLKNSIDFSLFKNIPFLLYCIGLPMVYFGQVGPLLLLPVRAVECGIERSSAAFLVSILGICNVVSRLLWGNISDISVLTKYKPFISGGTAILDGITSLLSYLAKDYISFAMFAVMWGTFSGKVHSIFGND